MEKEGWISSEKMQKRTGKTFKECLRDYEFCRTAEWNPNGNGQIIKTFFRERAVEKRPAGKERKELCVAK